MSVLNLIYEMGMLGQKKKMWTWLVTFWFLGWLDLASKMTGYKFSPLPRMEK